VRKEESRLLKSAGIVEMPASVSDILSESVTLKRWETRLVNLVERYEEISEELRRILNPVNIAVPAPGARRDAVQSSVKLIAMILSRKDVKKNRSNTKKQEEEEEEEEKKSDDKKTAEKLLLRISETFCEAPKVQDRAFQMFARAVTDERTPEGRLLWRWLDWLLSSTGNSEIQHRNQHTAPPVQRYSTAADDSTVATVTMSSMIDFTRFFEQMVGRSYGFDGVISEIAACTCFFLTFFFFIIFFSVSLADLPHTLK